MGWAALALAFLAAVAAAWRARRRATRQRQLMHLCHRAGLEFMPVDPFPDTLWLPFRVFGKGTRRGTENVVWDPRDDPHHARAFDFWYAEEGPQETPEFQTEHRMTCATVTLPFACPPLEVIPESVVESLTGLSGQNVKLELEAFNRRFRVVTDDRRFAVAFLDARMMEALMLLPPSIACAVNEDRMLLWAPQVSASEMAVLLEVARKLGGKVPKVVASLYPPRPPSGPHEDRWLQGHWSPQPTGDEAEQA